MALIDTEGRTMKERTGKGKEHAGDKRSGRLGFSEFGLAPSKEHTGCWVQEAKGRKYLESKNDGKQTNDLKGKRHIEMKHELYSGDEKKRQLGKIGLKKVKSAARSTEDKPHGKSGSELRALTSAQLAANRIKQIAHADPTEMGIPTEGPQLFAADQRLQREARVREAAMIREQLLEQKTQPNRSTNFVEKNPVKGPFAVSGDQESSKYHPTRRHCAEPRSLYQAPKHQGRSVDPKRYEDTPIPYDTVKPGVPYPDPLPIGTPSSPGKRTQGKGNVRGQVECPNDIDSVFRKRAEARPSIAPHQDNNDAIFGSPPPSKHKGGVAQVPRSAGVGSALLDHSTKPTPSSAHTGKHISGERYKPTNLW